MTKSILGCVVMLLTVTSASAQTEATNTTPNWRLKSFGVNVGIVHDVYQKMDLDMMYDFTRNPALLNRNLTGLNENLYRESNGSRMGINATLIRNNANTSLDHEIRLGAFYSNREPMISYRSPNATVSEAATSNSIIYCNIVNEVSLEGAYILRKNFGNRQWLSAYTGVGASLGSSFNNQLVVMENTFDTSTGMSLDGTDSFYEAKSSLFTRVNIPIGIQATILGKVNLLAETNIGIGVQSVFGGRSYFMPITTGLRLGLSYNL